MNLGRVLISLGAFLIVLGLVITLAGKIPLRLGRLPGDIEIHGRHTSFYFPIVTCFLVSIVLTFVIWLFRR
jgi:ribose/xylose/arabinose/galactoside ABC-type transport system permease subunit